MISPFVFVLVKPEIQRHLIQCRKGLSGRKHKRAGDAKKRLISPGFDEHQGFGCIYKNE